MNTRTIEITVKLTVPDDADLADVVAEMDHTFTYNGAELGSEIIDVNTEV